MLTLGYIGSGKSTNRYHLPFVLKRKDTYRVKTICSPHVDQSIWKKFDQIQYTKDVMDIMEDQEIDVVVVCTQQVLHYEYTKMALDYGKHVLVEKPFMTTLSQAEEIFAYAKEKGKIVQCYQNRRYDSDFLTVQKVIEEGKLGDIYEIEMHFDYYRPEISEQSTACVFYESYLYGHGCHTIDQVVSYFGKPERVEYDVRSLCGKGKASDYFDLDLFYGDNMKISVKSSFFRIKRRPSFVVYGKRGMFIKHNADRQEYDLKKFYGPEHADFGIDCVEDYGTITYVDEKDTVHEERVMSEIGDYGRVYDAFYELIVHGAETKVRDEQTLCVMDILETGARQCEETFK